METQHQGFFSRITANGLFLLVAGAILTCIVIPRITEFSGKKHLLRENRLNMQREIVRNKSLTDRQINTMLTRLEIFHNDNVRLNPKKKELKKAQEKLQEEINKLYLSFNNNAWWWCQDLYQEALILNLSNQDTLDSLRSDMDKYLKNLVQSTDTLGKFWHKCLSSTYDFRPKGPTTALAHSTRQKLDSLGRERYILIDKAISYFSPE